MTMPAKGRITLREMTLAPGLTVLYFRSGQEHAHRFQRALEGMQNEPEDFQRDHPQKRLVTGLAQDDRGMSLAFLKCEMALRDLTFNARAIRKRKSDRALGNKIEAFPDIVRQQGICRPAINPKPDTGLSLCSTSHHPLNICDAHVLSVCQFLGRIIHIPHSGILIT